MRCAQSLPIKIGGQERELKFTHNALLKLERVLPGSNLNLAMQQSCLPYSVEAHALLFALEGGGTKGLNLEIAEKWRDKYVDENGAMTLNVMLFQAILLSGAYGSPTKFKELRDEAEQIAPDDDEKNQ
ncbi:MAG: hypothetical protein LBP78_06690 [Acidaminococcales bacterium]|jgi:hypothetical protein|nr:hypothetical protein [Acidaminococcales bacterium]